MRVTTEPHWATGIVESITTYLLDAQNPDGGWGYRRGLASSTEVTSLGLLALSSHPSGAADGALRWLLENQRADGGWPVTLQISGSSWPTALAVLALGEATTGTVLMEGVRWLVAREGQPISWKSRLFARLFPSRVAADLDFNLTGWPWIAGAFSWVEPTSCALLALKSVRSHISPDEASDVLAAAQDRIDEAEAMLLDRVCRGGGWNYGNTRVLGEELWPYPDTTALGLLALQDVPDRPEIHESVAALERMVETEISGLNLSLAVLSLQLYGRDVAGLRERLANQWRETGFLGEMRVVALAALAFDEARRPLRTVADA